MLSKKYEILEVVTYALIWLALLMAFPFSIPQATHLPAKLIITLSFVSMTMLSAFFIESLKISYTLTSIFLLQLLIVVCLYFLHSDPAYANLFLQIAISLIIYIAFNNYLDKKRFIKRFVQFILIMASLSVLVFFLCLLINLKPFSEFDNPDGRTGYNFLFCYTNTVFDIGSAKIIRPAGFFDEPGTLAFYIIIAILLNDLTISNKKIRTVLFIAGVFTLSVAFFGIAAVYFLFRFKLKYLKSFFIGFFIVCIIGIIGYSKLEKDQQNIIYGYTFGRITTLFTGDSSSKNYFSGDNRSDLVETAKLAIKDSPIIGEGVSYASKEGTPFTGKFMGANILGVFGIHGILGGLILSLHVLYYAWICLRTARFDIEVRSLLVYLLLILQRPDYIGGILPYVGVIMLIYASKQYSERFLYVQNISCNSSI